MDSSSGWGAPAHCRSGAGCGAITRAIIPSHRRANRSIFDPTPLGVLAESTAVSPSSLFVSRIDTSEYRYTVPLRHSIRVACHESEQSTYRPHAGYSRASAASMTGPRTTPYAGLRRRLLTRAFFKPTIAPRRKPPMSLRLPTVLSIRRDARRHVRFCATKLERRPGSPYVFCAGWTFGWPRSTLLQHATVVVPQ